MLPNSPTLPRLVLASRGDALTPYLRAALERRFQIVAEINPELTSSQRLIVALRTFRPSRRAWTERFFKSNMGHHMRTRNARRQLSRIPQPFDVVFQVHALFDLPDTRSVLYIDCTHRQSADHWPDWNPLRGRQLAEWYAREKEAYHRAAHLFAFSQATRDSLVEHYGVPAERVSVVGAGVNFFELPDVEPDEHSNVILFIGNDFVRKGGELLLKAFARVHQQVPTSRLVLVGTKHAVTPQPGVEVIGRIGDRERIAELYTQAACFAMPSYFDPFGLVLLEAMAFGLPTVSTPTCGVPDIIVEAETGFLVPIGEVDALEQRLLTLLTDSKKARAMGLAGRSRVEESFSWDRVVERMAPALEGVLDPPPRATKAVAGPSLVSPDLAWPPARILHGTGR